MARKVARHYLLAKQFSPGYDITVDDDLARLVEMARDGVLDLFQQMVDLLRLKSLNQPELLVEFAHSPEEMCRRAAIQAAVRRTEPEVVEAVAGLAGDPVPTVRQNLAYALTDHPTWEVEQAAEKLLTDPDANVRQAAVWCVRGRPGLTGILLQRLAVEDSTWVRADIAHVLAECPAHLVLAELLTRLAREADQGVQQACANSLERHLETGGFPADLEVPAPDILTEARRRLAGITSRTFPRFSAWLNEQLAAHVDIEQLATFGNVLTQEAESGKLPHGYDVDEAIEAVMGVLRGPPPHAAVLVGESGTGKTAVVQELTHRLRTAADGPWFVLRMSPQDFMANTRYLGEWETRVRNVVGAIKPPRKVILYVPNIEELAWMGTWEKSEASVASALAPFIERGDVTILGESTVEAFRKGLGANRSLRRLFHAVELQGADPAETRKILQAVAQEAGAECSESVLDRLGELADFFVAGTVQPGRSVGLLRRVLGMTAGKHGPITQQDVLNTISTSTGIPVNFLDDGVALKRDEVQAFFEARVMGQPEAVDAVVDLVTLIKAGLTDPNKPYGVLLFVGPTGVGKTELARTLAEHLFGDPGRLIRLDMSEFATYEAFERLIGQGYRASEPGLLTAAVRERPFSVLLFDEIEKAHPNIYNLCLQIFDAGRLTDTQGRTADFRRTIIIITSNVGAAAPSEGFVGFNRRPGGPPDREIILRELGRWFRPEFLNRLDRIVTFRPLTAETAEKIARREVVRVLERSGIARRKLAVDVDPAVLPILLREGYSPTFGARPLKRTIERLVLLPVARVIAEGQAPAGSILRLVARNDCAHIEVEPPEAAETEAPPPVPRTTPVAERAEHLLERVIELHGQATPLSLRKSDLLAQSAAPGFYSDPVASRKLLDEVYRLDGILGALNDLEKKARIEVEKAQKHRTSDRDLVRVNDRLDALEGEMSHVAFLVACRESRDLGDALVTLRLVTRQGKGLDGVARLARMYQALARRRRLEAEVVDDRQGGDPPEDSITLVISGPGAHALLACEAGLHQVSRGRKDTGGSRRQVEREVIHVEVLPVPAGGADFNQEEVRSEVHPLTGISGRLLARPRHDIRLFHVPTMTAVRGWCDGSKAEALQRLHMVLRARVEAARQPRPEAGRPPIIRRYRLGPTTLVRDQRTGRHTARLDQVLEGNLDLFLLPPGP